MTLDDLRSRLESLRNAVGYLNPELAISEKQATRLAEAMDRIRAVLIEVQTSEDFPRR